MTQYDELLNKSSFFKNIKSIMKENQNIQPSINERLKLNIACGPNMFPFDGWINYDHVDFGFYVEWLNKNATGWAKYLQDQINYIKNGGQLISKVHDLRKGFPQHSNGSVELLYVGQAIEHINPFFEAPQFIKECYRLLMSGGVLRMTTPDLDLLIKAYIEEKMDQFAIEQPSIYTQVDASSKLAMLMYGTCAETCKFDHYEGHMFLYSKSSMTRLLNEGGFTDIRFYYETGKSAHPILAKEAVDQGLTHSFIVEAIK